MRRMHSVTPVELSTLSTAIASQTNHEDCSLLKSYLRGSNCFSCWLQGTMIDTLAICVSRLSVLTTNQTYVSVTAKVAAARDSNLSPDAEAINGGVERAVGAVALEV